MDKDNGVDGLRTIHKLEYNVDNSSANPNDNLFTVHNPRIYFINISTFLTFVRFEGDQYYNYYLREPKRKIVNPDKMRETRQTVVTTDNWSTIPYYPTTLERKEILVKQLIASGKPVPNGLLYEIDQMKQNEINTDVFNRNQSNENMVVRQPGNYNSQPEYAPQRPRAQASARIRLGGVF
jgi:hypothetical protein